MLSKHAVLPANIKKLHDNIIAEVDQAITLVADNPDIGERKKGDLAILRVYKFRSQGQFFYWATLRMMPFNWYLWKP